MGISEFQSVATLILGFGTALVAVTLYIVTRVSAAESKAAAATEALGRELRLVIEKGAEAEAAARHKLANGVQTADAEFRREMEQVRRETVKREEFAAMETRVMGSIGKLDTKMDAVVEKLASMAIVVERLFTRLERPGEPARP